MVRAASIIFHIDNEKVIHVLLVRPSDPLYGGPDFQIVKGILDRKESSMTAAEREAEEEAGLVKSNLLWTQYIATFGFCDLYALEVKSMEGFNPPDYEIAETKWFSLTEAFTIIRPYQKEWLGAFVHWLKEMRLCSM
jgi:8-oxo-dGTP pyrophosphatase MutT (NUDIX family)